MDKPKYIVMNRAPCHGPWGVQELCVCLDDMPPSGLLLFGDCATTFSYSAAQRAIQRTNAYADRHSLLWEREHKIVRLVPNPNAR